MNEGENLRADLSALGPKHDQLRRMSRERFDALTLWDRPAEMRQDATAASAWSTSDESIVIGVFHIFETKEFICAGFARDERGRYRRYRFSQMLPSLRAGEEVLQHKLGQAFIDAAGDLSHLAAAPKGLDLFASDPSIKRLHPAFVMLRDGHNQRSARELLDVIAPWLTDLDGNFVKDFQSTGYSARIWELYLWAAFVALGFDIDTSCNVPDFQLGKDDRTLFVEATTANGADPFSAAMAKGSPLAPKDFAHFLEHDMPQKFGSSLFSKLQKHYWEKPHVAGHPLIIAIADFHSAGSMRWSHTALPYYLYGIGIDMTVDAAGALSAIEKELATHVVGNKSIASNFFAQPSTENISAVLFSNAGTVVKFSRMGLRAGFGDPFVSLVRSGVWNDPIGGFDPIPFKLDVENPDYAEDWPDELRLYHNPNALHPIEEDLFPGIAHIHIVGGERLVRSPARQVLWSQTKSYDFKNRTDGRPDQWRNKTQG